MSSSAFKFPNLCPLAEPYSLYKPSKPLDTFRFWDVDQSGELESEEVRFKSSQELLDFFSAANGTDEARKFLFSLPIRRQASLLFVADSRIPFHDLYFNGLQASDLANCREVQSEVVKIGKAGRKPDYFNESAASKISKRLNSEMSKWGYALELDALPKEMAKDLKGLDEDKDGFVQGGEVEKALNRDLDALFRTHAFDPKALEFFCSLPAERIASLIIYMDFMRPYDGSFFKALAAKGAQKTAEVVNALLEWGLAGSEESSANIFNDSNAQVLADRLLLEMRLSERARVLTQVVDAQYRAVRQIRPAGDLTGALLNPKTFLSTYSWLEGSQSGKAALRKALSDLYLHFADALPHAEAISDYILITQKLIQTNPFLFLEVVASFAASGNQGAIDAMLVFADAEQLSRLSTEFTDTGVQAAIRSEIDFRHQRNSYAYYSLDDRPPATRPFLVLEKYGASWCNPCYGERQTFKFWMNYFSRYFPNRLIHFADLDLGEMNAEHLLYRKWSKKTGGRYVPFYSLDMNGREILADDKLDDAFFKNVRRAVELNPALEQRGRPPSASR